MPNTARWAATLALTATAVCGPLSGAALAVPASLHAPSALVLTLGHGENAALAAPQRAVTLSCAPTASGSHPDAVAACAALRAAGGDLDALPAAGGALCTRQYDPVVVTVQGVWEGRRVDYQRTFSNECVKNAHGAAVFAF
ncbi:subtilase-type protease inhibitor [Streptomyces nodosus]|uniref:subtilase-type protease inhibitor n=1 Tax=Streptomyces nodosus TaxID=40318 RepID=UPI00380ECF4D